MSQKNITLSPHLFLIPLPGFRFHRLVSAWLILPAVFACTARPWYFAMGAAHGPLTDAMQAAPQPAKSGESSSGQASSDQEAGAIQADVALVQAALTRARVPDAHSLSEALGIDISRSKGDSIDWETNGLKDLGDLNGDGVSVVALNRLPAASGNAANETTAEQPAAWELFLLAWDGAAWRASLLKAGFEPYELRVISSSHTDTVHLALILYGGATAVPYPAIYQLKEHVASLLWDGRADESQYEGYPQGKIEFLQSSASSGPEMITSGRADPGLLQFPKGGRRGFDVQAVYGWDGRAYIPKKTEYSPNQDYQLYQFISALHLHNFRAAYALIDPAKFLKTDSPSLDAFRQRMQNGLPEFLDDQIFEAREPSSNAAVDFAFELTLEDKHYVYHPSFSADSKQLLTGLERLEEKSSGN